MTAGIEGGGGFVLVLMMYRHEPRYLFSVKSSLQIWQHGQHLGPDPGLAPVQNQRPSFQNFTLNRSDSTAAFVRKMRSIIIYTSLFIII